MEIIIQNVVLTNEMIDAYDPDALISWVQSLKSFETKLVELIEKIKNDKVMPLALMVNDDLQKIKRYKKVEHGRVPESFKPEWRRYMPGYKEEEKQKPKPQSKPQPKPTSVQKVPSVESVPKVVKVEKPKVAVASIPPEDIFGFNEPS